MRRRPAWLPLLIVLLLLLPVSLRAQEETSTAFGFSASYVTPVEGLGLSMGMSHLLAHLGGGVVLAPAVWGDFIITTDEDSEYYRDTSSFCRDGDGAYVDDILCTPEMSFAGRAELALTTSGFFAGPGVRVYEDVIEPYGFLQYGMDLFAKVSIGEGFQQFELGWLIGI